MRTYNRATVIGRVGNEVVLRHTQSGTAVVNLSLATSERRKDGPEHTTWHRVVLWDRLAELAHKFVSKGRMVYVEGPLSMRGWTDAQGLKHERMEMTARELLFMGDGPKAGGDDALEETLADDGEEKGEVTGTIPF
jgi:single-strand DNA-binding protein